MKKILLIVFMLLAFTSCDSGVTPLSENLLETTENSSPYYLEFDSGFSYCESDDGTTNIKQGQQVELFSNIQIYDDYLYVYSNAHSMCRLNPATGNVTTVCQRPLCLHNTKNCPFVGLEATSFRVFDKTIYFTGYESLRTENGEGYGYYIYDLENDTVNKNPAHHSDSTIRIGEVLITEAGDQYYYDCQYDDKTNEYHYYICKYSPQTQKTEVIAEPEDANTVLVDKIDNKLYYLDGTGFGIFNEDTGEKEQLYKGYAGNAGHDDKYFYFRNEHDHLYRLSIGGNKAEQITDFPVRYYYITNDYIYYKYDEVVIIGQYENGEDADIGSQKIYRMNKDGTDSQCIWEFDEEFQLMNCKYFVVSGDYIYSKFFYWDEEKDNFLDGDNPNSNGGKWYIIRIDITNQNIHFVDMMP